jgi:hypothetical protein
MKIAERSHCPERKPPSFWGLVHAHDVGLYLDSLTVNICGHIIRHNKLGKFLNICYVKDINNLNRDINEDI